MGSLRDIGQYSARGITWVLATLIYVYLGVRVGQWLDARYEAAPLYLIISLVLAIIMSLATLVKNMYEIAASSNREPASDDEGSDPPGKH